MRLLPVYIVASLASAISCTTQRRENHGFLMSESSETPEARSGLTERQRTILEVIRTSVTTRGYPPSIREIGDAVGLTSTSSVAHQRDLGI